MSQRTEDQHRELCASYRAFFTEKDRHCTAKGWTLLMHQAVDDTPLPNGMFDCQHARVKALTVVLCGVRRALKSPEDGAALAQGLVQFMAECESDAVASVGGGLWSDDGSYFAMADYSILRPALEGWMALPYQALKMAVSLHQWPIALPLISELTVETRYGRRPRYMATILAVAGETYQHGMLDMYRKLWELALLHDWFWIADHASLFQLHFDGEEALEAMAEDVAALRVTSTDETVRQSATIHFRHMQACRSVCLAGLSRRSTDTPHVSVLRLEAATRHFMDVYRKTEKVAVPAMATGAEIEPLKLSAEASPVCVHSA